MDNLKQNIIKLKNILEGTNVQLIGVSKTKPPEIIQEAYMLGLKDFGENYVLELLSKIDMLPNDIRWHMIGHLQTNKVKALLEKNIYLIHSVDSLKLATIIDKYANFYNKTQNILLEINVTGETTKTGFNVDALFEALPKIIKLSNIKILGFMCMAKPGDDPTLYFKKLVQLKNKINNEFNTNFNQLSMGMTNDYMQAISLGATYIRIGRGIFGERNT